MKQFFTVRIRFVAVVAVLLVAGGAAWYIASNAAPALGSYTVARGNVAEALDEPGTVVAEDKADLSFQEAGRIAHVYVKEGDAASFGAALADLNSASFKAGAEQANAALAAAQVKLDELQTGATPQTIAVSQTALASAEQSLANGYTGVPNALNDAYAKANDAVRNQLAAFFSTPEGNSPQLTFSINDSQVLNNIQGLRVSASTELNAWQAELARTTANASGSVLDVALQNAAGHLSTIQDLADDAMTALTDETGLLASTLAAYKVSATTGLNEVNGAVTEITAVEQNIASEKAAIAQAQAGLNLTTASSTSQVIQEQQAAVAQAQAAAAAAQVALDNASLVAPFPGTVQDLTAQVGQVVAPGVPVLSLLNNDGLKIQTYVSEVDVAKMKAGDAAEVTLDAFGTGTTFPTTVTTIDSAETQVNGTPSYLITLHFTNAEPQVKDGMTGNIHIVLAEDDNVIVVPSRLVLNNGNQYFVLVKTSAGIEQKQVQIGPVGDNGTTEITSGIHEGDTLANF
ncbi:MAG: efflux RND transporter periplasmic adaptor subunit [Minisyncoccia bacterium]|jgi:RND family efflux transporter MFP subunit